MVAAALESKVDSHRTRGSERELDGAEFQRNPRTKRRRGPMHAADPSVDDFVTGRAPVRRAPAFVDAVSSAMRGAADCAVA